MEPKLNCDETRESLPLFIDGGLDDVTAERVNAHLASCRECRREHESLERLLKNITALYRGDAPEHAPGEFLAGVRQHIAHEKRLHAVRTWLAVAAAVVFTVSAGLFTLETLRPGQPELARDMTDSVAEESVILYAARQFFDGFDLVDMGMTPEEDDDTYDDELLYTTTLYTDLTMVEAIQALDTDTMELVLSGL